MIMQQLERYYWGRVMDIIERARELRSEIEQLADVLDDSTALDYAELFPSWKEDTAYEIGTRVRYAGILYKYLQAHTSQSTWNPEDAASLWARVLIPDPETIPEWIQPDSTNPYMTGDKVTHNGKHGSLTQTTTSGSLVSMAGTK